MSSLTQQLQIDVVCPACHETYSVPLDLVEESQRLIKERGGCSAMASYECPATHLASLVSPELIGHLESTLRERERERDERGDRDAREGDEGAEAPSEPRHG